MEIPLWEAFAENNAENRRCEVVVLERVHTSRSKLILTLRVEINFHHPGRTLSVFEIFGVYW